MPLNPPVLISYTETTDWVSAAASKSTAVITWQAGDLLVVLGLNEGLSTFGTPTATGLLFAVPQSHAGDASTSGSIAAWALAASAGSSAVAMTETTSTKHFGFGVWVWRGSGGVGRTVEQHTGGSAASESAALTPTGVDSAFAWAVADFAASALGSPTPGANNTRQRVVDGVAYSLYAADLLDQPSGAAGLYGISGAGAVTGPFSIVAVEILAAAALGTYTSAPAFLRKRVPLQQRLGD